MRRTTVLLGGLLLALLLLAAGGALWQVRRNLPDESTPAISGLTEPVHVTFDDRGVPTVAARSADDAIRIQGYLTARERLFQLELQRRAGEGRLSELFGKAALDLDRRPHRLLARLTNAWARARFTSRNRGTASGREASWNRRR